MWWNKDFPYWGWQQMVWHFYEKKIQKMMKLESRMLNKEKINRINSLIDEL